MEMCTPNSEQFQGNMRLSEIYDPEPAQNSTERGARYGTKVRSSFPVEFATDISETSQQDPRSGPSSGPTSAPSGLTSHQDLPSSGKASCPSLSFVLKYLSPRLFGHLFQGHSHRGGCPGPQEVTPLPRAISTCGWSDPDATDDVVSDAGSHFSSKS